ncbi:hypothetical protein TorRG33x02_255560 [Trema orientale]|uniref:DUF1985 domain-containing protein n=1 Tax=Trema orientale TaxID=63057 RepID=A0A2P5DCP1_TREOI|nr:hypothetical protein TorRG33x02_255560 [Trema orientale]
MTLVDDQDRFNDYSWGLRSYNDTIGYLHKDLKFKTPNESNSVTYELCGFLLVFQVWAYEIIPMLGKHYANRLGNKIPKILNWSNTLQPHLDDLLTSVFGSKEVICL